MLNHSYVVYTYAEILNQTSIFIFINVYHKLAYTLIDLNLTGTHYL